MKNMKKQSLSSQNHPSHFSKRALLIWLVSVSFVLFQFFLQLSSGVIIATIMKELQYNALMGGLLSSAFYYVYTSMQIPAGILFDRFNTRYILTFSALLCGLSCILFARCSHFHTLLGGRLLIGAGSSFAFVGLAHLLRQHFPIKYFAVMIGLSETLAFLLIALGMANLGSLIQNFGWRSFMLFAGITGLVIALHCWLFLPKAPPPLQQPLKPSAPNIETMRVLLSNRYIWINGLFVALGFTVITVFAAMWAVPFLEAKLDCSIKQAGIIDAWLFVGAAISCPLGGYLFNLFSNHRWVTMGSSLITALLLSMIIYLPIQSIWVITVLMFLLGLCCGGYMLAFSIINDLAPQHCQSTATGFTNTMAMISAPIFLPLIGYLVDYTKQTYQIPQLLAYKMALLMMPAGLILAAILAGCLPKEINSQ